MKSNSKCLLEHQLWLNSTKLKKWQNIEKERQKIQNNEDKYVIKWKLGIYGKFVSELERRLRKLSQVQSAKPMYQSDLSQLLRKT